LIIEFAFNNLFFETRLGIIALLAVLKNRARRNIKKTMAKTGYMFFVIRKTKGRENAHNILIVSQTTITLFLCQRSTRTPAIGPKSNTGRVMNNASWERRKGVRSFGNSPIRAISAI
jgi:hypothetical protein